MLIIFLNEHVKVIQESLHDGGNGAALGQYF